jgi:acyl dehydratase
MIARQDLRNYIGQTVGTSRWFLLDQERVDGFADVTEDHQFIHTDLERAAKGPFAGTIAHGFLTLSMLSAMLLDGGPSIEGETSAINYGFNKIRFLSPVRSGSRVRAVFELTDIAEKGPQAMDLSFSVSIEIEDHDKPALVAEWINRRYFGETT